MRLIRAIVPWIISAAICVLAVEMLGMGVFLYETGTLVYRNDHRDAEPVVELARYKQRLHPYFGYTGPYSLSSPTGTTNNLGFLQSQKRSVPFKPDPNDFVVFVFGSSIAGNVVSPPQGGEPLRDALQRIPQLNNKNVVVYSMAQGPQKQPQQLMELAFVLALGQHIDLVLNVDGAVEFTSGLSNFESGTDPVFPPAATLGAIGRELTPVDANAAGYYEVAYHVSRGRDGVKRYAKLVRESNSGLGFLINRYILAYYSRSLIKDLAKYESVATGKDDRNESQKWNDSKKLLSLDMAMSVTKDNVIEAILQSWLRCSDLMKLMATANGAAFIEIVHASPYHSKKKLTPSETAVLAAVPDSDYFRRASVHGYDLIEQRADMFKSRGIITGLTLFDDNPDTIYIDSTGHFSRLGETILGQFIAEQVSNRLELNSARAQNR
jgi:hypothetical protein